MGVMLSPGKDLLLSRDPKRLLTLLVVEGLKTMVSAIILLLLLVEPLLLLPPLLVPLVVPLLGWSFLAKLVNPLLMLN